MTLRRIASGQWCAGALAARTFTQMSDPQFGMYSKNQGFVRELRIRRRRPQPIVDGPRSSEPGQSHHRIVVAGT